MIRSAFPTKAHSNLLHSSQTLLSGESRCQQVSVFSMSCIQTHHLDITHPNPSHLPSCYMRNVYHCPDKANPSIPAVDSLSLNSSSRELVLSILPPLLLLHRINIHEISPIFKTGQQQQLPLHSGFLQPLPIGSSLVTAGCLERVVYL